MAWTEEWVELLKKLWTEGLSASQIARQMGGVTRNAVIGKVHRLGLSGRATPARVSTAKVGTQTTRTRQTQPSIAGTKLSYDKDESLDEMKYDPAPEPILSPEERASVLNLTEHTCKWPIGDPLSVWGLILRFLLASRSRWMARLGIMAIGRRKSISRDASCPD